MTSPVVHNYARALVELMKDQAQLDITREIAETLIDYFKKQELIFFLRHPKVPTGEKKEFFRRLVPPETPQEIFNFINLLIDRGRLNFFIEILNKIVQLTILEQGYEIVTFISAQPMTEGERKSILGELETVWQIQIYPEFRVNPNILGGIIIQRGDMLYDGSLNGQLGKIRDLFTSL